MHSRLRRSGPLFARALAGRRCGRRLGDYYGSQSLLYNQKRPHTSILFFVLVLFSVSNHLEHESGLLTVTVLGVALANWPKFPRDTILEFNESLTVLLISVLFIILAARVELSSLLSVGFAGLVLLAIVMLVARPLSVWASAIGSNLKTNEKLIFSNLLRPEP